MNPQLFRPCGDGYSILSHKKIKMGRPISRIDGKTYSATWVPVGTKKGIRNVCVIFDDSFKEKFSEVPLEGHRPFDELPFSVGFEDAPWPEAVLSTDAYLRFVVGEEKLRPMGEVFDDVASAIDSFVDFDSSFADQRSMSEFMACWAISTYAIDVFDTVGYVWPNGERASGKTQCLKAVMKLAFMGTTVTSSSSFASIRDEASLGATLGFDDCENIRGMDQNKRELLLAGNTKGTFVTLKIPGAKEGKWDTLRVDAFAARAFTSISLPDPVLASRTILIPLVRSGDLAKTRRKPTNEKDWTIAPNQLRDEIWLNVVRYLGNVEAAKAHVNAVSEIAGREFDIFQGPLTIAAWLEQEHGQVGLFERMSKLMEAYLNSKTANQLPSLEALVLMVLFRKSERQSSFSIHTSGIAEGVRGLCSEMDITEETLAQADAQAIGMLMRRLGFEKNASHGNARSWQVTLEKIERHAKLASVDLSLVTAPPKFELPGMERQAVPKVGTPW